MFRTASIVLSVLIGVALPKAHAITDMFECRAKIVDLKTNNKSESVAHVAGFRMVTPNTTSGKPFPPNIEVTSGEAKTSVSLSNSGKSYDVNLNLRYGLAKRPIGNPTEARQYVCGQVSLMACQDNACYGNSGICLDYDDPFDAIYGWTPTIISKNVPVFNEQLLKPISVILSAGPNDPQGAKIDVSCAFRGTYL